VVDSIFAEEPSRGRVQLPLFMLKVFLYEQNIIWLMPSCRFRCLWLRIPESSGEFVSSRSSIFAVAPLLGRPVAGSVLNHQLNKFCAVPLLPGVCWLSASWSLPAFPPQRLFVFEGCRRSRNLRTWQVQRQAIAQLDGKQLIVKAA